MCPGLVLRRDEVRGRAVRADRRSRAGRGDRGHLTPDVQRLRAGSEHQQPVPGRPRDLHRERAAWGVDHDSRRRAADARLRVHRRRRRRLDARGRRREHVREGPERRQRARDVRQRGPGGEHCVVHVDREPGGRCNAAVPGLAPTRARAFRALRSGLSSRRSRATWRPARSPSTSGTR